MSVYAQVGTYYNDFDVDDTGVIMVNWDQGTASYIEAGWWQPHTDGSQAATQLYGTAGFGQIFPSYLEIPSADKSDVERADSGFPPVGERDKREKFGTQMSYFLECVREGRQPRPGGEEGLVNMRLVDAAYKSAEAGQVIVLKEV